MVLLLCLLGFFFYKQKTSYEVRMSDWSSDVCSSDLLIYHVMDDPCNWLHVLATSNPGCTGGQAGGFAMDGSGIGSALQCNRRGDGFGNGANWNVVDEVTGFGLSGHFSSTAICGGVEAIKQNSGVTGTAGIGPALQVEIGRAHV